MINRLPNEVGVTSRLVLPPKQGWKANTLYLVQVAIHQHNPIHEAVSLVVVLMIINSLSPIILFGIHITKRNVC